MTTYLRTLWRLWSGRAMAEHCAYSNGYDAGFKAGLNVSNGIVRGAGYIDGFAEGRESTRTIPLDSSFADEDEEAPICH